VDARRVITPFVIVLALLAGGSVTASCTTSSVPRITQDQVYASGVFVSLILVTLLARAVDPTFTWRCHPNNPDLPC
jgi:hypothetical protein